MDVAVLGEVDKGRQFRAGLGGFDGTLAGGGGVVVGAGAGEVVIGAGVGEQVVDRLGLADGGLTVGEGGLIHAVTGGGTNTCKLWPACTAASTRVDQVVHIVVDRVDQVVGVVLDWVSRVVGVVLDKVDQVVVLG